MLQYFVVFLKCTLEKGLGGFQHPFIVVVEILPSLVSISIIHAFHDSFSSSSPVGPCITVATLLTVFSVGFSFNEMSL